MASTTGSTRYRVAAVATGVALLVTLTGCGGARKASPSPAAQTTTASASSVTPVVERLTITSPAFADGAPIPVQFTCKGANVAPPLTWSAPPDAAELALVVDDPDAVGGLYIHWIVTGIAPGPGSTTSGQTPDNGRSLANSGGQQSYFGPCPPSGSGTHHYRFTLYQLSAPLQVPAGSAGAQAAHAIAQAAAAQATLTGTFQG
ncbi:YbhB/YbcL family Raf kinase inhibitor-like protein [Mycobacterium sp. SM1]|uniref:YbhB/YbcL family Raf kinase inhibitor-like protein n=1 Tax=Mycobacterium sp. SM1 TaxID=2816243 RepID=UPI001BCBA9A5|nr:YbhB/YbcL family Raf kinase inhibitor-like protein [Mycobacterium sp. SM1]MBS4729830.1 YbhB/YbcL family Raf kinase inhibitor-like protein [Mycobacterium sp. SM1]